MVRCRPITLGQSEPTRPDSTAHHRRQSAGLSPVETTVTSGLCEVGEFDRLTIAEMFLCDPGARDGAAGALLLCAHQAAASLLPAMYRWISSSANVQMRPLRVPLTRPALCSSRNLFTDMPTSRAASC